MSARPIPEHGTHARYKGSRKRPGCRCADCTRAAVRADACRKLDRLAGRPRSVPAGPAQEHIRKLRAAGCAPIDIFRAAGMPEETHCATFMAQRTVLRTTAEKILSVPLDYQPERRYLDAFAAVRRIQALHVLGYPKARIAAEIKLGASCVSSILLGHQKVISADTDRALRKFYAWAVANPGKNVRAMNEAARLGWHGPAAWDDIDNPAEQPDAAAPQPEVSKRQQFLQLAAERRTEIRLLASAGQQPAQIAQRVGLSEQTVRRTLAANHPALYLELTA